MIGFSLIGSRSKRSFSRLDCMGCRHACGIIARLVRPRRYVDTIIETIETAKIGIGSGRSFRLHLVSEKYRLPSCSAGCAEQVRYRDPWLSPNRDLLRQVVLVELRSRKIVPACHSIRTLHRTQGGKPRIGRGYGESDAKCNHDKKDNKNNSLQLRPDHGCVLFVQHPSKNAFQGRFQAVPLLRVHGPSVIVVTRRRGASRSRPVLGRSL